MDSQKNFDDNYFYSKLNYPALLFLCIRDLQNSLRMNSTGENEFDNLCMIITPEIWQKIDADTIISEFEKSEKALKESCTKYPKLPEDSPTFAKHTRFDQRRYDEQMKPLVILRNRLIISKLVNALDELGLLWDKAKMLETGYMGMGK